MFGSYWVTVYMYMYGCVVDDSDDGDDDDDDDDEANLPQLNMVMLHHYGSVNRTRVSVYSFT